MLSRGTLRSFAACGAPSRDLRTRWRRALGVRSGIALPNMALAALKAADPTGKQARCSLARQVLCNSRGKHGLCFDNERCITEQDVTDLDVAVKVCDKMARATKPADASRWRADWCREGSSPLQTPELMATLAHSNAVLPAAAYGAPRSLMLMQTNFHAMHQAASVHNSKLVSDATKLARPDTPDLQLSWHNVRTAVDCMVREPEVMAIAWKRYTAVVLAWRIMGDVQAQRQQHFEERDGVDRLSQVDDDSMSRLCSYIVEMDTAVSLFRTSKRFACLQHLEKKMPHLRIRTLASNFPHMQLSSYDRLDAYSQEPCKVARNFVLRRKNVNLYVDFVGEVERDLNEFHGTADDTVPLVDVGGKKYVAPLDALCNRGPLAARRTWMYRQVRSLRTRQAVLF